MKVALVPFVYGEMNYGGILQFYALQKTVGVLGAECEILRAPDGEHVCPSAPQRDAAGPRGALWSAALRCRAALIKWKTHRRLIKISEFKAHRYVKSVDLSDVDIRSYGSVVCGSDQIWNPGFARERTFLAFVPDDVNKVIYAASLAVDELTERQQAAFRPLINRLEHVSVREISGKGLVEQASGRTDVQVVLDPTLLLTSEEWDEALGNPKPVVQGKYVLTYFLGEHAAYSKLATAWGREHGCKVVNIPYASGEHIDHHVFGDVRVYDADPAEFVSLIKNAECVFTDSFHACVFSILNQRQFFAVKRDHSDKMSSRIYTLFEHFGIEDRFVVTDDDVNASGPIDYSGCRERQLGLRASSLEYLKSALRLEGDVS